MDATQADVVYQLVVQGFAELGAPDPRCVSRSFLLRDLCYAGQAFRCGGFQAVWLLDRETVEFHDEAGNSVRTVNSAAEVTRKAA
jgi:hypothetical protein